MNFLDLDDDFELLKQVEEDSVIYYYLKPKNRMKECVYCNSNHIISHGY